MTLSDQQDGYNVVNGYNVFTLRDEDLDNPKFILIVKAYDPDNPATEIELGRMTKWPNADGYAHFDIQGILKAQLKSEDQLLSFNKLSTTDDQTISYKLYAGYLDTSAQGYTITDLSPSGLSVFPPVINTPYYTAFNGRKPSDDLEWAERDNYVGEIQSIDDGTGFYFYAMGQLAKVMSDRQEYLNTEDLGWTPCWYCTDTSCVDTTMRHFTVSPHGQYAPLAFMNVLKVLGDVTQFNNQKIAIRGWYAELKDANGDTIQTYRLDNIIANGGGPAATTAQVISDYIKDPYQAIQLEMASYSVNAFFAAFNALTAGQGKYLCIVGFTENMPQESEAFFQVPPPCLQGIVNTDTTICTETAVFTLDDAECNDLSDATVYWTNSFGFTDWFQFFKRQDKYVEIDRKEYTKPNAVWDENVFSVSSELRSKTNYANVLTEGGTLRTRWLSDSEMEYLKNLLISNNVFLTYGIEQQTPIVIKNPRWNERTYAKDRLFQLELDYELSNPTVSQIG